MSLLRLGHRHAQLLDDGGQAAERARDRVLDLDLRGIGIGALSKVTVIEDEPLELVEVK
jgi:hypothetical protein